jgi:hypothetical protein
MALYGNKIKAKVISAAVGAAEAHQDGKTTWRRGGQTFNLTEGGMCQRFVAQCFEAALGLSEWHFDAASAKANIAHLQAEGLRTKLPLAPGDILGWPGNGKFGHIALFVGDVYGDGRQLVAENTSSGFRGDPSAPGTKLTSLSAMSASPQRFRLFPTDPKNADE